MNPGLHTEGASDRVLFVDDEPNVLSAYCRALQGQFALDTASSATEAMEMVDTRGPYAVVVSDLRMPDVEGDDFLRTLKHIAPNTIRLMLTGHADEQIAVDAARKGDVFQFLSKPCAPELLAQSLTAALEQARLVNAVRALKETTLFGSIRVLTDVLAQTNPSAFGCTSRLRRHMGALAKAMELTNLWELEAMAMLSRIGVVIMSDAEQVADAATLESKHDELHEIVPLIGHDLLRGIPGLEHVAEAIKYQQKCFDGSGPPWDDVKATDIPLGARLLKIITDFDALESAGMSRQQAISKLLAQAHYYDLKALTAFHAVVSANGDAIPCALMITDLREKMVLTDDVRTLEGKLIACRDAELTSVLIDRLIALNDRGRIGDTVSVVRRNQ